MARSAAQTKPVIDGHGWVFVIRGTRAWAAWEAYQRSIGRPINYYYNGEGDYKGKTGRYFRSLFPPGYGLPLHEDDTDEAWQARNPPQND